MHILNFWLILFYNTPLIINTKNYPAPLYINGDKTNRKVISKILVQKCIFIFDSKDTFQKQNIGIMLVVNRVKAIIKENIFLGNSNFKGVCIRTNTTPKDSLLEFNYFGNLSNNNIEIANDFINIESGIKYIFDLMKK